MYVLAIHVFKVNIFNSEEHSSESTGRILETTILSNIIKRGPRRSRLPLITTAIRVWSLGWWATQHIDTLSIWMREEWVDSYSWKQYAATHFLSSSSLHFKKERWRLKKYRGMTVSVLVTLEFKGILEPYTAGFPHKIGIIAEIRAARKGQSCSEICRPFFPTAHLQLCLRQNTPFELGCVTCCSHAMLKFLWLNSPHSTLFTFPLYSCSNSKVFLKENLVFFFFSPYKIHC